MKILALEFSSATRSVAVIEADTPAQATVRGRAEQQAGRGTHAFKLIATALREAGLEREQVEGLAVGLGPGSYTGIRVAIAVAQGWQLAQPVSVLGLSSVEVLAWQALRSGLRGPVTFLVDAQRGEFYGARYELEDVAPRLVDPLQLLRFDQLPGTGGGTWIVEPGLQAQFPAARALCPDAAMLGLLAAGRDHFVTADQLEPIYLRAANFVKSPPPRVVPPVPSS